MPAGAFWTDAVIATPGLAYSLSIESFNWERTVTVIVLVRPETEVTAVNVTLVSESTPCTLASPVWLLMEITPGFALVQEMVSSPSSEVKESGSVKFCVTEEAESPCANCGEGIGVTTFPSLIMGINLPFERVQYSSPNAFTVAWLESCSSETPFDEPKSFPLPSI